MTVNNKANLPREAMPWARDIEREIEQLKRDRSVLHSGAVALNQFVSNNNTLSQAHTVQITETSAALAEVEVALSENQAVLDALNAPDGPLATMNSELETLEEDLTTLNTVTLPALDGRVLAMDTDLGLLDDKINNPTTGLVAELDNLNEVTLPALGDELDEKMALVDSAGTSVSTHVTARNVLSYTHTPSGGTDNFVIETNIIPPTFVQIKVRGYNYNTVRAEVDVTASVYAYTNTAIASPTYTNVGDAQTTVRYAYTKDATPRLVLILTPPVSWAYTRLNVPEVVLGWSGASAAATQGWVGKMVSEANLATEYNRITSAVVPRDLQDTNLLAQGWRTTGTTTIDGGQVTADTITATQIKAGTITATQIATRTIVADRLVANTITANEIAAKTITAAEIKAGTITATEIFSSTITGDKIAADTIGTRNLIIGDLSNYWNDPAFAKGVIGWTVVDGGIERYSDGTQVGNTQASSSMYVVPDGRLRWSFERADRNAAGTALTPAGNVGLLVRWYRNDGSLQSFTIAASTITAPVEFVVPAGVVRAEWGIRMYSNVAAGTTVRLTDMQIRSMAPGTLIQSGAITTAHMTVNTINGDRILANTLNASKIVAGSITTDRMTANTINGDRIAVNTLNANRIVANSITANQLSATAIDGKTITGATIRTAADTDRIVLAGAGLDFISKDPLDGNQEGTVRLLPTSGSLYMTFANGDIAFGSGGAVSGLPDVQGVMADMVDVSRSDGAWGTIVGDVILAEKRIVQDGQPIAYRQAAGVRTHTANIAPSGNALLAVTFPSGRFTHPPIVTVVADSGRLTAGIQKGSITTTGFTISVDNWSPGTAGGSTAAPLMFYWQATQMLTTGGAG